MRQTTGVTVKISVSLRNHEESNVYYGEVMIGETVFSFQIVPTFPLDEWKDALVGKMMGEVYDLLPITIQKYERPIHLDTREHIIFRQILFPQVLELHRVRTSMKAEKFPIGDFAISEASGDCSLDSEVCRILTSPKFACVILDGDLPEGQRPC
jgi:hypothetical protein